MKRRWTAEDREAIAPLEARWTENAGFRITADRLLDKWSHLVDEVERGYDDNIDDYRNDLDSRKLLQEAIDALPADTARRLRSEIDPLDAQFLSATVRTSPPPWSGGWWAERIPRRTLGMFASDFDGFRPVE
jgi:hypothetical protein